MKRCIPAVALLLVIAAVPAFALDVDPPATLPARTVILVSDVIKMAQAGVSDEAIIAYVHNFRRPFDVSADDIIAMTDARVSSAVIKTVEDEAAAWKDREPRRERETTNTRVYVTAPYYDPWFYPGYYPYSYDPFFYGPRFSFGIGFGFGHFRGGHFRRWH